MSPPPCRTSRSAAMVTYILSVRHRRPDARRLSEIAPFVPNRSTIAKHTHFFRSLNALSLFISRRSELTDCSPVRKGFVLWIGCTLTITVSGLIDFVLWTYQFGRELFIKNATVSYRSVLLRVVFVFWQIDPLPPSLINWSPSPLRV